MSQNVATVRSSTPATVQSAANTASAITLTAVAGVSHHITSLDVTVDATVTNMAVTLTEAGTTKHAWRMTGTGALIKVCDSPLRFAPGKEIVLNVAAGGGTVVTVANLASFTQ